jgi:outer membrane protein assembly factor BamE (lipoprotein component of BamABCDE complex)
MKSFIAIFFSSIFALALLAGCATATSTYGTDFSTDNVSKIVKGKTTAAQLVTLFGEPYSKTPGAPGQESWMWTYSEAESHGSTWLIGSSQKTTSYTKTLYITLKNGMVTNYSLSTQGTPPTSSSSTSTP